MMSAAFAALFLLTGCATTAPIDRQDFGPKRMAMVAQIRDALHAGNGFAGWPASAPFDAPIVAAGAAAIRSR